MAKTIDPRMPLAIVGAACRFPGPAYNLEEFNVLLASGKDAVSEIPQDRFAQDRFISAAPNLPGHSFTNAAGIIPKLLDFDPDFFGISRTEALDMDPQQRMILEMTWEAMEDAGIPPSSLRGSFSGVYMGAAGTDTGLRNADDIVAGSPYTMTGSTLSLVSNRVSYLFDLHGPSLSIDTACSSSLVALHLACEALRNGEIPLAVVGGINCLFSPYPFVGFSKARMLSPDGRCKVFDASGNGYVRSEGGGVILVTSLAEARKKGWDVMAVIAGSGVNSDGRTTGVALPNPEAQAALIQQVYERFGLDKKKLVYVEAHGTGTAAGDPLEASAIGETLGQALAGKRELPVGSVKSNVGHLETASGMAGLMKAILVLRHGKIPPNLHFNTPNPAIDFKACNIFVPTKTIALPQAGGKELVGINSFGFGGTNAHVVLQKPGPDKKISSPRKTPEQQDELPPLLLSARSPASLRSLAESCAERLVKADAADYRKLAAGLALKRDHLERRAMASGNSVKEVRTSLLALAKAEESGDTLVIREDVKSQRSGVFVFSGNGSQWPGMGVKLFGQDKVFRASIEETDAIMTPMQGWSILDILKNPNPDPEIFRQTEKSQPLIFSIQVAIVRCLEARGILPAAVIGHSVGEVAAAWCAGSLTLEEAALGIHVRSKLQAPLHGLGGMAAANMSVPMAREILKPFGDEVAISSINTNSSLSLSGKIEALKEVVGICKKRRIAAKMLDIPYPFHTHFMDAIKDSMRDALASLNPQKPRLIFFSTVLGKASRSFALDRSYWSKNARQPVLFAPAVKDAFNKGFRLFMEIGPSPVLRSYLRDILRESGEAFFVSPTLSKNGDGQVELDAARENAWKHGWKLDLKRLFPAPAEATKLPAYPWNREHCWHENSPECRDYLDAPRVHPLLGWQMPLKTPVFENTIHIADFPWLADHVAGSQTVYPAAAFIESMLAAGLKVFQDKRQGVALERVNLFRPLVFSQDNAKALRLCVDLEDGGLRLEGRNFNQAEAWGIYAKGRIVPFAGEEKDSSFTLGNPESFGIEVDRNSVYSMAERVHLHYGPAFRTVTRAWFKTHPEYPETLSELGSPSLDDFAGMNIPPTLLDGAFHSLFLLLGHKVQTASSYLPAAFERVTLVQAGVPRYAHARLEKFSARSVVASFRLLDAQGTTLAILSGCRFRRAAWLEQEHAPSAPYAPIFFPVPHPDEVRVPKELSVDMLKQAAEKPLLSGTGAGGKDSMHSWLLLQLASLAAGRESILSLQERSEQSDSFSCEEFLSTGRVALSQGPWFRHILEKLEEASFAERDGEHWHIPPQDKRRDATVLWRTVTATAPDHSCESALLAHVFASRKAILSGEYEERENELLPAGLMQAYYSNAASLLPFAKAVQNAVRAAIKRTAPGEELRVLQIAKEPESFISDIIPSLKSGRAGYTVAVKDKSEAEAGMKRFGQTPGLCFAPISLDSELSEDSAQKYHLIVLAWTLREHLNTAMILEKCRNMLAPGGIIIILEQGPSPFADYVFGAQPDWWRASIKPEQPASLLQNRKFWERELQDAAFANIESLGGDNGPAFLLIGQKTEAVKKNTAKQPEKPVAEEDAAAAENKMPCRWVIVSRKRGSASARLAARLEKALAEAGEESLGLMQGTLYEGLRFNPENPSHWSSLVSPKAKGTANKIIYLAGYDNREDIPAKELKEIQASGSSGLMAMAQAWESLGDVDGVWVLAGGAMGGDVPGGRPVPSQGALLGFTRVLANELRSARIRFIDLQSNGSGPALEPLLREILHPAKDGGSEAEIVLTRKQRLLPRLAALGADFSGASSKKSKLLPGVKLGFDQPGRLRNLYWREFTPGEPGPGQVRISVSHTGLNFRDVMWSMGLLLDEALEKGFSGPGLGIECSGIIDAVGSGVSEWSVGDEVLCFAPSCFSSQVITAASAVAAKPGNVSFAEAATIPVAFITAWYALKHLARLQPGQRVLIHGAAGGVGLAAIQIAAHLGLEIHATAGAPEKHNFLRRLGITRLYSSRSLDFAHQVMEATGGEGVDCVLNSLSGEAIAAGVSVLRPFGHFIELGKRDFFADSPMRLFPFSNNLSYYGVDVDQLVIHKPELSRELFAELMDLFAQRKLVALPHTVYSAERVVDAFQTMQQASHIGKLVVSLSGAAYEAQRRPAPPRKWQGKADASYLISGGTGGLGLAAARMLARGGAKNILLLSRRGVIGQEESAAVEAMRAKGINVIIAKADVTDEKSLQGCLDRELKKLPPLAGIIHAAAVLDDGMVNSLTPDRIKNALSAKAMGAWNLHQATLDYKLDFFVLFSSATTLFGNPGQSGYVAANCMLESLAAWRRSKGLKAQVIGWGPIDDVGMLTRNPKARQVLLQRLGISPTSSAEAMHWLEQCIAGDIGFSAYFSLNWQNRADLQVLAMPRFSLLRPPKSGSSMQEGSSIEAIRAAAPQEGLALVLAALREEVSNILRIPSERIPVSAPLAAQGMDSLMAVELALAVEQKFELTGYSMPLTDKTTLQSLAKSIYGLVTGTEKEQGSDDLVEQLTRKHGLNLSREQRDEMKKSMTGDNNDG